MHGSEIRSNEWHKESSRAGLNQKNQEPDASAREVSGSFSLFIAVQTYLHNVHAAVSFVYERSAVLLGYLP